MSFPSKIAEVHNFARIYNQDVIPNEGGNKRISGNIWALIVAWYQQVGRDKMLSWPPCHPSRGSTCPTPDTTTWSTWPGPPAGRHVWLTGTCLPPPGREEDGRWCSVWPQHSPSWPRVCGPSDCPAETDLALPVSWGHGGAVASHTSWQYWSPSLYQDWTHQNYYI